MAVEFCTIVKGRKHRAHQWVNTETLEPIFGVQANVEYGKWAHVLENNAPLLFATRSEAEAKAKELSLA